MIQNIWIQDTSNSFPLQPLIRRPRLQSPFPAHISTCGGQKASGWMGSCVSCTRLFSSTPNKQSQETKSLGVSGKPTVERRDNTMRMLDAFMAFPGTRSNNFYAFRMCCRIRYACMHGTYSLLYNIARIYLKLMFVHQDFQMHATCIWHLKLEQICISNGQNSAQLGLVFLPFLCKLNLRMLKFSSF